MRDLSSNIEVTSVLDPVEVAATATHTGIDLKGFNSASIVISCGADDGTGLGASHNLVYELYESGDGETYTPVGSDVSINATGKDESIYKLGYVGGKRYLQLVGTVKGVVKMPVSIVVVKGHPEVAPV